MILEPVNDAECLTPLSQRAADATQRPDVQQLAAAFTDTRQIARFIRSLPQRDDKGTDWEAPSVMCDVPQRARIGPDDDPERKWDPNCVERSITYLAMADLVEPTPWRQLATVDTGAGRHTFPVEDGLPVVLDPLVPRFLLHRGLEALREARGIRMTPDQTLKWIVDLAEGEARNADQLGNVTRAREAFYSLLGGGGIPRNAARDVGWALALAQAAASRISPAAQRNVCACARALDTLSGFRNLRIKIPGGRSYKVKIDWQAARELGATYAPAAVTAAAVAYGVPLPVAAVAGQVVGQTLKGEEKKPHGSSPKTEQQRPQIKPPAAAPEEAEEE